MIIFLTSGSSWTVPSNWNSSNNKIHCIGAGGAGQDDRSIDNGPYDGSGGGAYSSISNLTLTPGASVSYSVGAAGVSTGTINGGDTYFNGASYGASSVAAKGGFGADAGVTTGVNDGVGGQASAGIGTKKFSGGNGNGDGGGGAGGPDGNGQSATTLGGSGNNGAAGGGVGGAPNTAGGDGNYWTQTSDSATAGPGGGAGTSSIGKNGGNYGGGAGPQGELRLGGNGGAGLIVIEYTPAATNYSQSCLATGNSSTSRSLRTSKSLQGTLPRLGNAVTFSNVFNNALWSALNTSVTSGFADPFGGSSAWNCVPSVTSSVSHRVSQSYSLVTGKVQTVSLYAKTNGYRFVRLLCGLVVAFDLVNGTVGTIQSNPAGDFSNTHITPVSGQPGWYRISFTLSSNVNASTVTGVFVDNSDPNVAYAGDGTSGVLIYGFMINEGGSLQPYQDTGATTPALSPATLARVALRIVVGTSSTLGSMSHTAAKIASAASSLSGTVSRALVRSVSAASSALSGTLSRVVARPLSGVSSLVSSRTTTTSKLAQAASAPTGTVARHLSVVVTALASVAGSISRTTGHAVAALSVGAAALLRSVAASLLSATIPLATLLRGALRATQSSATVSATLQHATSRSVTATSPATAVLSRLSSRALSALAAAAPNIQRVTQVFRSVAVTQVSVIRRVLAHAVDGAVASASASLSTVPMHLASVAAAGVARLSTHVSGAIYRGLRTIGQLYLGVRGLYLGRRNFLSDQDE